LYKLQQTTYDVLVIGGGITGAGIALDAASRGLKVALVEKNDFAFGTSSRSTKLIHGGLRYLKQLEFGLVKEVGSERAVVHGIAPHLVVPEKMLLPLSEKRGLGYWLTSIGLKIYDWLAGVKREDQRRMLTRMQTLKAEPLLRKDDIKGGALYAEYRTDDARLTVEIIKTAVRHGADILNYVRAVDFIYENQIVSGIQAHDFLDNTSFVIHATAVINAAGPWVDELRVLNKSREGKRLHLTKGVHIVLPHHRLPVKQAIYFDVDDGRMIFAIPRGRTTYVGTTDTNYEGSIDHVSGNYADAAYLVQGVNATFPSVQLSIRDIESSWAGLRPLIHEEGKSASELSRKDEIFESSSGLISIAGGKLTGYRKMAERVVDLVVKKHFAGKTLKDCYTDKIKLHEKSFSDYHQVQQYTERVSRILQPLGIDQVTARYLVENYGREADTILDDFHHHIQDDPRHRLLLSELHFCLEHEMITNTLDFFIRRTGLLYFNISLVQETATLVTEEMGKALLWPPARIQQEINDIQEVVQQVKNFSQI
jgi:glycerol-3-phosphate dehydrogenase